MRLPTGYRIQPDTRAAANSGSVPSTLMCRIFASSSLSITGNGRSTGGNGQVETQQVAFGPDEARQTGDNFFDGVNRELVTCAKSWLK